MMNYLLTVSGEDKRGLVEALATTIESLGGNWLQSRLCRLEGQFAGIVTVEFSNPPQAFPETVETLNCQWKEVSESRSQDGLTEATIKILAGLCVYAARHCGHFFGTGKSA